jgi:hypothetical protein
LKQKLSLPTVKNNSSKLHSSVYDFCKQRFPFYTILQEQTIEVNDRGVKECLFVDIFIKELNLNIECHGIQHFKFNSHFFKDKFDFDKSQKRDILKEKWLKDNGFKFVIFKYDDKLTYEFFNKVIDKALKGK